MLRISQLKLSITHTKEELEQKIRKVLRLSKTPSYTILRRSVDARKKPELFFQYSIDVEAEKEDQVYKRCDRKQVMQMERSEYHFPVQGYQGKERPVIIGAGPAGLFCCYMLAEAGFKPVLLERGKSVEERTCDVRKFWETGVLDTESNVQFGEGGAGTFSDGKLNTLVKDKSGRNRKVLSIFVREGAPEEILYDYKPHIGTDVLYHVIQNMRKTILENGGEIRFQSKVTDLLIENGRITGVEINNHETLKASYVVLAPGHSARDIFAALQKKKVPMEPKPFAVGFRVEHPQKLINHAQYGMDENEILGSAPYKLTASVGGRGVYSFCMCPGGYVVNASSEEGHLAVNGMSYYKRDSKNANSAVIITIDPSDYGDGTDPLSGVAFQRELERRAYLAGNGRVPVERLGTFREAVLPGEADEKTDVSGTDASQPFNRKEKCAEHVPPDFSPCIKGAWAFGKVHDILPKELSRDFVRGMEDFSRVIPGFSDSSVLIEGVESRTSSPVRILRDERLESDIRGLFPCGEGAGYAGGITSAAMDGIKVAEEIAGRIAYGEQKQDAQTGYQK